MNGEYWPGGCFIIYGPIVNTDIVYMCLFNPFPHNDTFRRI